MYSLSNYMKQTREEQYAKAKEKIQCEKCGAWHTRNGKSHHLKTNKHLGIVKTPRTEQEKKDYHKRWRKANKERHRETSQKYYQKNRYNWLIYNDKDIHLVPPKPIILYFD